MGLPGYYSNLLKKYRSKLLINTITQPKYLFIDANCLFHPECFAVLADNPDDDYDTLIQKMFERITQYIDYLIEYSNPSELVFIGVDGVAPFAKIMQQRKRRYKTDYDNKLKSKIKEKYGIVEKSIWSNICITPGTKFMEKLHNHIEKYIENKKKNSCLKFIYSSFHSAGEGEHKILQFIKNNITDNDNIVIYGLDADLIFLALASGKDNIYLLREKSHFEQKSVDEKSIKKELIYASMNETKESILVEMKEKTFYQKWDYINDYIFICFFLGNDFLPHFPTIDIHQKGLDTLMNSYSYAFSKSNYKSLITVKDSKVIINQDFLDLFLYGLGSKEQKFFDNYHYYKNQNEQKKKEQKDKNIGCNFTDKYKQEILNLERMESELVDMTDYINLGIGNKDEWKNRYYEYHFKVLNAKEIIDKLCGDYMYGLKWVCEYYFLKCSDWQWGYQHIVAPFISDLYNYKITSTPDKLPEKKNLPIDAQLLCVIPPTYIEYLPKCSRKVMKKSDASYMFPSEFNIDTQYKTKFFECTVIVPNIDLEILDEVRKKYNEFDKKESKRLTIF